jgi:CheY-like chemotaxis protein
VALPRILVVEDDEDIRRTTIELLEMAGYASVEAENGQQALERLGELAKPCIVLLDLVMPVMDGLEFLEHLDHAGQLDQVTVLIISASPGLRASSGLAHRLPILLKPFSAAHLLNFVEAHFIRASRPSTAPPGLS